MDQNGPKFTWTKAKAQAAVLVAEDDLSDEQLSAQVGIGRTTLKRWKADPAFRARVRDHIAELEAVALDRGIARRTKRVDVLNDLWRRGLQVIEARAVEHQDVPGGDTGLLVRQVKLSATGREVAEYAADTALLKELREHSKQAAQELGQWVEKQHRTVEQRPDLSQLSDEELADLDRLLDKASHQD
jgi:uncharacterized protein YjiS (DUF1127 family)